MNRGRGSNGPRWHVSASCFGCKHERSERYVAQSDNGLHVYCTHEAVGKRLIGDTCWDTPTWCPYRAWLDTRRTP